MDHLKQIRSKILTADQLKAKLLLWRFKDQQIVFTNGCFDLLHPGHLAVLAAARDLGDKLIVGLNTDSSVKRLKGENRPVQNEVARAELLAALSIVDAVVLFDEDTPEKLIELVTPDYLVKGGDYKAEDVVGYNHVTQHGGQVVIVPLVEGLSTTNMLQSLKD